MTCDPNLGTTGVQHTHSSTFKCSSELFVHVCCFSKSVLNAFSLCSMLPPRCDPPLLAPMVFWDLIMGCGTSIATETQGKDEKTGSYGDGPFCHFQTGVAFTFEHLMGEALVIQT